MTVVPAAPVLCRIKDIPESIPGRDGTLRYAWNTICLEGILLLNAMPVDACPVERQVVVNIDMKGLWTDKISTRRSQLHGDTYITPT